MFWTSRYPSSGGKIIYATLGFCYSETSGEFKITNYILWNTQNEISYLQGNNNSR